MSGPGPKMTYISAQYRVRVEFTRADCLASDLPPDIIERATAILRRERAAGRVAFYRIFKTRFEHMWAELRDAQVPEETLVALTVATGAPPMTGIELVPSQEPEILARLTIAAPPATVGGWRFKLFKLTVGRYLRRMGINEVASPAHLHALWLRAQRGEAVVDAPLSSLWHAARRPDDSPPFHLLVGDQGAEIILVVSDVRKVLDDGLVDELIEAIVAGSGSLSRSFGRPYLILAAEIRRELASAGRGPERFGIDLPFVYLAAIADLEVGVEVTAQSLNQNNGAELAPRVENLAPRSKESGADKSASVQHRAAAALAAPESIRRSKFGDGIALEIATDHMSARITVCEVQAFSGLAGDPRAAWLDYLESAGIAPETALVDEILPLIEARQSLVGQIIARGRRATVGVEPVLTAVKGPSVAAPGTDAQSMRDAQQRQVVQRGQVIASFVWKAPPVDGMDVLGHSVAAANPPFPAVTLGAGVTARPDGTFIATISGVPQVAPDVISVNPVLVLNGNVNLASGNLRFEGAATVTGSVERGSVVEIKGDLTVLGMIEGGTVKVSGNLTVMGGIVMTARGGVRVGGNITAAFIENAHAVAAGDITVTSSIASSHISAQGNIAVIAPDGRIIGGETLAGGNVHCANLGRASAMKTEVRVGVDAAREARLGHRQRRRQRLVERLNELSAIKKELGRRSAAQTTKRHKKTSEIVVDGLDRMLALVDRLDAQIKAFSAVEAPRHDATITVTGILSSNCAIVVCGSKVLVGADVEAVSLVKNPLGGGRMVALSEAPAQTAERPSLR